VRHRGSVRRSGFPPVDARSEVFDHLRLDVYGVQRPQRFDRPRDHPGVVAGSRSDLENTFSGPGLEYVPQSGASDDRTREVDCVALGVRARRRVRSPPEGVSEPGEQREPEQGCHRSDGTTRNHSNIFTVDGLQSSPN
jgi:hypothetical protein